MTDINNINIFALRAFVALVDNDFRVTAASLDIGMDSNNHGGNMSRTLKRLKDIDGMELFTYKPHKRGSYNKYRHRISGLTKQGRQFYTSIRYLLYLCEESL